MGHTASSSVNEVKLKMKNYLANSVTPSFSLCFFFQNSENERCYTYGQIILITIK